MVNIRVPRSAKSTAGLGATFGKDVVDPTPLGTLQHRVSFAISKGCADATQKKIPDNLLLCGFRFFSTASAVPRVLHGKVKGRGPRFVLQRGITSCFKKVSHSSGT